MQQGTDAHAIRGGENFRGVEFTFSLQDFENLPDTKSSKTRMWTPEEDDALLRFWPVKNQRAVAKKLGVCENTARRRYRELRGE